MNDEQRALLTYLEFRFSSIIDEYDNNELSEELYDILNDLEDEFALQNFTAINS